ncbi:MAG: glucokinase [Planctomycetota bacterium]|nr:MAG: glucokinase [Planctomycetota bacterium]
MTLALGADLGATKIRVGVVEVEQGCVLGTAGCATGPDTAPDAVLRRLGGAIERALAAAGLGLAELRGLGVAVAGRLDLARGAVVHAPNLGWRQVPLAERLRERYPGLSLVLENDALAAALGEWNYGAGRGARTLVVATLGTGVGGGIIAEGRALRGASGGAGEIGHLSWRPGGEPCSCGGRGHYEAYAGGAAVLARLRARLAAGERSLALALAGGEPAALDLGHVFAAAAHGCPLAGELVREYEQALAALAVELVTLLDPERIVLGGGVSERRPELVELVRRAVRERPLGEGARTVEVLAAARGADAAVLGAAWLAAGGAGSEETERWRT